MWVCVLPKCCSFLNVSLFWKPAKNKIPVSLALKMFLAGKSCIAIWARQKLTNLMSYYRWNFSSWSNTHWKLFAFLPWTALVIQDLKWNQFPILKPGYWHFLLKQGQILEHSGLMLAQMISANMFCYVLQFLFRFKTSWEFC